MADVVAAADHLQNFACNNQPAFCVGLAPTYDAPSARQHLLRDAVTDDEMAGHWLSDAERAALRAGDITRLYELGANPYLIRRVFRGRFKI